MAAAARGAPTGGSTGTGGGGGSGGGGGGTATVGCQVSDLPAGDPNPLISDFMTLDAGVAVIPIGGIFRYGTPGPVDMVEAGAWHITLNAPGTAAKYW